jgi:hypothetical protein
VKDSRAHGRTARTALDAAAVSMARGASGVWLRAGSRLGLACRGTVYLLVVAGTAAGALCDLWLLIRCRLGARDLRAPDRACRRVQPGYGTAGPE